jgi:hypothetical protein
MEPVILTHNEIIVLQIRTLEVTQNRTIREHLLGDPAALARLQALDNQIAALRAQLTKE